jgi:hypothetical protein
MHRLSRIYTHVTGLALALALAVTLGLTASDPSPTSQAESTDAVQLTAGTKWRCGKWHETSESSGYRWCVRFSKIAPRIKKDGTDILHNNFRRRKKMHCSLSKSTTWTFHASATVKAEAGVIFTKASAEVTAGGSRSTTTTSSVGGEFWVKGKGYAYCARGHGYFALAGATRKQVCGVSGCRYFSGGDFTGRMPSITFFEIGPGRNIEWKRFLPQR